MNQTTLKAKTKKHNLPRKRKKRLTKLLIQKSMCEIRSVVGRKVSYEKSATGFSVKVGGRRSRVNQEYDAFVSNVGVDTSR